MASDSNSASGDYSFIGGGTHNRASGDSSVVGGGSRNTASGTSSSVCGGKSNLASDIYATISGGRDNQVIADGGFIGGGYSNNVSNGSTASCPTISGGNGNFATAIGASVGGGLGNNACDSYATVSGGYYNGSGFGAAVSGGGSNIASGDYASVPGGLQNRADGNYSFAGGYRAQTNGTGVFAWADATGDTFGIGLINSFNARASNGFRFWTTSDITQNIGARLLANSSALTTLSDSTQKTDIRRADTKAVLEKVAQLTISEWRYKAQPDPTIRHMGPMAQDFWKAFRLGEDSLSISTIDPGGIALAAIQELYKEVIELRARVQTLEAGQQKAIKEEK